jgi:hypothetical protein
VAVRFLDDPTQETRHQSWPLGDGVIQQPLADLQIDVDQRVAGACTQLAQQSRLARSRLADDERQAVVGAIERRQEIFNGIELAGEGG